MDKILLIIPAYNEAENISWVIDELSNYGNVCDFVIVNDGSKDNTKKICEENGYNYIDLPINVGLADTFKTGVKYAIGHGYDMVLQYDGDGQHNPKYISKMVEEMKKKNADVVIGSRFKKRKECKTFRNIGSYIIQCLIKITTGKKITDPTSGMRLYNSRVMNIFASQINIAPEPDTIAFLIKSGFAVEEVEVEMRERKAGSSYLNIGNSIRYMLNVCISIFFVQWFRRGK